MLRPTGNCCLAKLLNKRYLSGLMVFMILDLLTIADQFRLLLLPGNTVVDAFEDFGSAGNKRKR